MHTAGGHIIAGESDMLLIWLAHSRRTPQLFTIQRWEVDSNSWRSVKLRVTATGVEELGEAGAGGST